MPRCGWAACLIVGIALIPVRSARAAGTVDVPLPGGTRALARALALDPAPEPARAIAEFARVVHDLPEGTNKEADALLQRVDDHAQAIARFGKALATVQTDDTGISLALASNKATRGRLKAFLDLVGFALVEKKNVFSVVPSKDKEAAERVKLLNNIGIDLTALATRLNQGDAVRITIPTEQVPIPIGVAFWTQTILRRSIAPVDLVPAILSNRRAALLCRGLMGLNDETLEFLAQHPALVQELYDAHAPAVGAFADSLRVHEGRVLTPGGASAVALWEKAVDARVSAPERFIKELFAKDGGKFAYVYAALANLDGPRQTFALGLWIADEGTRLERFKALVSASLNSVGEWDLEKRPFYRPSYDAAQLLSTLRVESSGAPGKPDARRFWQQVFEGTDVLDDASRQVRRIEEQGVVDAAWLVEQIASGDLLKRTTRFEQFMFGQRGFARVDATGLADALVALRAFPRFPALLLTLNRSGVESPSIYAMYCRIADVLDGLEPNKAHVALRQFQAAVALLERFSGARTLDQRTTEQLFESLSTVRLDDDRRFAGAIAHWIDGPLKTALKATVVGEETIIDAAAGVGVERDRALRTIEWEDRQYRVDLPASEARRLRKIRDKQRSVSLDFALALQHVIDALASRTLTLQDLPALSADLKKLATTMPAPKIAPTEWPAAVELPKNPQPVVARAAQDLARITAPRDLRKAVRVAEPLVDVADRALAEALTALTYAVNLGDADGTALLGGDASLRHDFGFADHTLFKRGAWSEPRQELAAGRPWRVQGSLLGLDVALGKLSMRRLTTDKVEVPKLVGTDLNGFVRSFALLNPYMMRDEDQGAIAAAVERGKRRVAALMASPDGLSAIADEIGMDGWRRRAVQWSFASVPNQTASYFSMAELLALGHIEDRPSLDLWGTAASVGTGCFCTSLTLRSRWPSVTGRHQLGLLPAEVPDLNLRVAVALDSRGLPAVLAKGVLSAVARSYLDEVRPMDDDDWLGFVRAAQATSDERIEDAVAALTAGGPLVPATRATAVTGP